MLSNNTSGYVSADHTGGAYQCEQAGGLVLVAAPRGEAVVLARADDVASARAVVAELAHGTLPKFLPEAGVGVRPSRTVLCGLARVDVVRYFCAACVSRQTAALPIS
jgi:hypothetical protein